LQGEGIPGSPHVAISPYRPNDIPPVAVVRTDTGTPVRPPPSLSGGSTLGVVAVVSYRAVKYERILRFGEGAVTGK